MSAIGTVIASGVVPATQQAAQAANRRDKRLREQQSAAQRTREVFETHLETLEENDETETNARLRTDAQMHTSSHAPNPPGLEIAALHRRDRAPERENEADASTCASTSHEASDAGAERRDTQHYASYDETGHYRDPQQRDDPDHPHIDVTG
jgi:hypothetical protein